MASHIDTGSGDVTLGDPGPYQGFLDQLPILAGGGLTFQNVQQPGPTGQILDAASKGADNMGPYPPDVFFFQEAVGTVGLLLNGLNPYGGASWSSAGSRVSGNAIAINQVGVGVFDITMVTARAFDLPPLGNYLPLATLMEDPGVGYTATRIKATQTSTTNIRVTTYDAAGAAADGGFTLIVFN